MVLPVVWASEEPGGGVAAEVAVVSTSEGPHSEAGHPRHKRTYPLQMQFLTSSVYKSCHCTYGLRIKYLMDYLKPLIQTVTLYRTDL